MTATKTVTAKITIAAAPADIFPYFVEPALLVQWIGDTAKLDPEPSGLFALEIGATAVRGTYLIVEPPRRVVFTWGVPGSDVLPAGSTTVEILLKAHGNSTIVELFHRDLPPDLQTQHEAGWKGYFEKLRQTARP